MLPWRRLRDAPGMTATVPRPDVAARAAASSVLVLCIGCRGGRSCLLVNASSCVRSATRPASALPATWDAIPAGQASVGFGSEWLRSRRSAVLLVPSVIVPEESCVLINPQHPLAGKISARVSRGLEYDRLFRRGAGSG